jgi:hypothetical protein
MRDRYAKDRLVCLSVSVDDKDDKAKSLAFLKRQNATFTNYLLDEPAEVWQTRLDVAAPPAVLVFDRDGRQIKKFPTDDSFTYADVEKFVAPLLANHD